MGGKDAQPGKEDNKYLFTGKELQNDFGSFGWYDYGKRFYDPQLGRFHTIDPLAEWHMNYTPYHYCFNNPVNLIDPFGLDTTTTADKDGNPVFKIDEVQVTGDKSAKKSWMGRLFSKIGKAFRASDEAITGDPEPYEETVVEDGVDMDWWESEESYGNKDVISPDNENFDKIFKDERNNNSSTSNQSTENSDKNVNPQNKTTSTGQPIELIKRTATTYPSPYTQGKTTGQIYEKYSNDSAVLKVYFVGETDTNYYHSVKK